jgi:hypothetical protein
LAALQVTVCLSVAAIDLHGSRPVDSSSTR